MIPNKSASDHTPTEIHALFELYEVPYFAMTKQGIICHNLPEIKFNAENGEVVRRQDH
jgi:hypothetical protein